MAYSIRHIRVLNFQTSAMICCGLQQGGSSYEVQSKKTENAKGSKNSNKSRQEQIAPSNSNRDLQNKKKKARKQAIRKFSLIVLYLLSTGGMAERHCATLNVHVARSHFARREFS
ncbi:hypothetical protein PAAG_11093 [Paracoccidioides lutzii Pb01]|uniref:Uncharacterized protein n=1 Tax=Paracoccidioides lutzii (strain ATCC MYA-826 / Pb01) TaxID=502779 RepID=A0A0A2V7U1_PARBA|nr:hypothetical protein PAAG_11093 [Paracoccidioides lutzii Pb01]KGQ02140.1 hypothetical protein PAAG_11093 [Paracoccidioides lutzii Pb01]